MREVGGQILMVPDEAPPGNREKKDWWPPGWGPGRRIESQRDLFELLGVRTPLRSCCRGDSFSVCVGAGLALEQAGGG